jgi:hypothetical protein
MRPLASLSEACTTFFIMSEPKSPRMVPLAALRESVGPRRSRTDLGIERLVGHVRVVLSQLRGSEAGHFATNDLETGFFKAVHDVAHVFLLHAIRLTDDEGFLHKENQLSLGGAAREVCFTNTCAKRGVYPASKARATASPDPIAPWIEAEAQ